MRGANYRSRATGLRRGTGDRERAAPTLLHRAARATRPGRGGQIETTPATGGADHAQAKRVKRANATSDAAVLEGLEQMNLHMAGTRSPHARQWWPLDCNSDMATA
jgi:hypothetical protein